MAHFSNAELAQKLSDLVAFWSSFNEEYATWLGGTVSGGPGNDGNYTVTDYTGQEQLIACPAKLADNVSGYVGLAEDEADAAAASAAAALVSENAAAADAIVATAQAVLADADRIAAELAETGAVDAKVTAIAQAAAAVVSAAAAAADAVLTAADVVLTNADVVLTNADVVLTNADVTYAAEWAIAVEDLLISAAAGGNQSSDYSALHWAAKADGFASSINPALLFTLADDETVTGRTTFSATRSGANGPVKLQSTNPFLVWDETDAATDEGGWLMGSAGGDFYFRSMNDAGTNLTDIIKVNRTGDTVDDFTFGVNIIAPNIDDTNWDTAYGWGDHASGGYADGTNEANWDTAYGWGDHASTYVPLAGGTMTGPLIISTGVVNGLHVKTSSSGPWALRLERTDLAASAQMFFSETQGFYFNVGMYTSAGVIQSGGTGGFYSTSGIYHSANIPADLNVAAETDGSRTFWSSGYLPTNNPGVGNYYSGITVSHRVGGDYASQLVQSTGSAGDLMWRDKAAGTWGSWYRGLKEKLSTGVGYINSKEFIASGDTWMRLNANNDFTSGIYTPYGIRLDGNLLFGASHGLTTVTGSYGSVQTTSSGVNAYAGFSINAEWVFMSPSAGYSGIYNDTDNEWCILFNQNGSTDLYYNGVNKAETSSQGFSLPTGRLHFTGNSGFSADPTDFTIGQYTSTYGYLQVPGGDNGIIGIWSAGSYAMAEFQNAGQTGADDHIFVMNGRIQTNENGYLACVEGSPGDDSLHHYLAVKGGSYHSNSSLETGYMRIKLPTLASNSMLAFTLHGYTYDGNAGWGVRISGYEYTGTSWYNESVDVLYGSPPFDTVQWGGGTGTKYILLGTAAGTWAYPQAAIANMIVGYAGQLDQADDWVIDISASTPTGWVSDTTLYCGASFQWRTSGQHPGGSVTISTSAASGGSNGDIHYKY